MGFDGTRLAIQGIQEFVFDLEVVDLFALDVRAFLQARSGHLGGVVGPAKSVGQLVDLATLRAFRSLEVSGPSAGISQATGRP